MRLLVLPFVIALAVAGCLDPARDDGHDGLPPTSPDVVGSPCEVAHGLGHPCLSGGLQQGQRLFWNGTTLPPAGSDEVERSLNGGCNADPSGGSASYALPISGDTIGRLQVGLQIYSDDPSYVRPVADSYGSLEPETYLRMALFQPGGLCAGTAITMGTFGARMEVDEDELAAGEWRLRIDGTLPGPLKYRMRATILATGQDPEAPALPNLRIIPPFEAGFFVPTATYGPGAVGPALPGASCMAEEYSEALETGNPTPLTCLRFSMGLFNAGLGPFRLREPTVRDPVADAGTAVGLEDIQLVQNVCSPSSTNCLDLPINAALVARFHQAHLHFHYQNAYVYALFQVMEDEASEPELVQVGRGGKLGLNPTNEAWEGWTRFYQQGPNEPVATGDTGNVVASVIAIQPGWGDVYDWNRGGNYVTIPLAPDGVVASGDYVIRGTADPLEHIVESNETDNESYAHIRISGVGSVALLERGYGAHPWDPDKVVFEVAP